MSQTTESGHNDPEIIGEWRSADGSRNCIQLAQTAKPDVWAQRNTFDPQHVTYNTESQLLGAAANMSSILGTGGDKLP